MVLPENPQRAVFFELGGREVFEALDLTPVPLSIVRHPTLSLTARALYMAMLTDVDEYGIFQGTLRDLARWMGVSVRSVRQTLEVHLIPAKLVETHRDGVHRVFRCTAHAGSDREPPEQQWDEQVVYFAQGAISQLIKIGTTTNLKKRLQALRTGSPEPLVLLGAIPGGDQEERELHQRFSSQRINGEWFSPSPELLRAAAGELDSSQG